MDDFDPDDNAAVQLASLAVLGAGLVALFLGLDWFWVVFVVGFAVVVPIVAVLTEQFGVGGAARDGRGDDSLLDGKPADVGDSKQDALDELRTRYARGDLSDAEFERKVEALLETETPESARRHVESASRSSADERDASERGAQADGHDTDERASERETARERDERET